jgi:hypothetical protein
MNLKRFSLVCILTVVFLAGCAVGGEVPAPSGDATATLLPTPALFPDDTPVLVWHREGGIAGFCDDLTVRAGGSYSVANCMAQPGSERTGQLDAGQLRQLTLWVMTFQSFETSEGEHDTFPDAMIVRFAFKGTGTAQAGPDDIAAINNFASLLVAGSAGGDYPEAVARARDFLAADLNIPVGDVSIVSFEFVEWPDSCLGLAGLDEMCAQVITPGYRVLLQAGGSSYELHTDETGTSIRRAR